MYYCIHFLSLLLHLVYATHNVYDQGLPNCQQTNYPTLVKKTSKKGMLCPMFRDEEGFLSEWIAYYQMHGFDHIILYDDSSTDNSLIEIQPWVKSGFVTVVSNLTALTPSSSSSKLKHDKFHEKMHIKSYAESHCKQWAVTHGYDYFISLDIDEYVIPINPNITLIDELEYIFNKTTRKIYCMEKLNYQSTPHLAEPVNLLTIEAYQHRMPQPSKMSYYTTVANKCAYDLSSTSINTNSTIIEYMVYCCNFHGCDSKSNLPDKMHLCNIYNPIFGALNNGRPWLQPPSINHYSRSLEKYALKQKTWETASGESVITTTKSHHTQSYQISSETVSSLSAASAYDIPKFLARNLGWYLDTRAIKYTCQLRQLLSQMTGEKIYLRPGNMWYRNLEFGKNVSDPDKRGRHGRAAPPGFVYNDGNPYHYHGGYLKNE